MKLKAMLTVPKNDKFYLAFYPGYQNNRTKQFNQKQKSILHLLFSNHLTVV